MKGYHWHHIIPKHAGGTDDRSNLILLTIEEHIEAHKRLWCEHGRWEDYYAYMGLSGHMKKDEILLALYMRRRNAREPHKCIGMLKRRQLSTNLFHYKFNIIPSNPLSYQNKYWKLIWMLRLLSWKFIPVWTLLYKIFIAIPLFIIVAIPTLVYHLIKGDFVSE